MTTQPLVPSDTPHDKGHRIDVKLHEVLMDPSGPNTLYAATYQRQRRTWGFNGGGPGSGIYKTTDGGRNWTETNTPTDDDPLPLKLHDSVIVEPDDYGKVPVNGKLITLNRQEISIRRNDDRAGEVNVHFPRAGYRVYAP